MNPIWKSIGEACIVFASAAFAALSLFIKFIEKDTSEAAYSLALAAFLFAIYLNKTKEDKNDA